MEPTYYVRVLRLRWKVIVLFVLVGALGGFVFTLTEKRDTSEPITYWVANHKLIVSSSAEGRFPNLLQTALLVTGGEVPLAVAERLDRDESELTRQVRTVTNPQVNVVEISATSTDADEAALLADAFADGLVSFLSARDTAAYEAALGQARAERDTLSERLLSIDNELDALQAEIDAVLASPVVDEENTDDGSNDDEQATELSEEELAQQAQEAADARAEQLDTLRADVRSLQIERTSRLTLFESALGVADDLERAGPPPPLMETLDLVPPYQVSQNIYTTRIDQGRRGENNFSALNVEDGSGGGLKIGETVSNPVVRTVLGAVAGLLVGIGAVLLHLRIDPRLRTKSEIEDAFDLPVLAEIPKFTKRDSKAMTLHALTRSRSSITEAYRMVRSALLFAGATTDVPFTLGGNGNGNGAGDASTIDPATASGGEMRVVMVTSPGPSEGKTTTTANLAVVLAEAGHEVLVVNCDYRLPKLHRYFGQPHEPRRTFDTAVPGVTIVAEVTEPTDTNPTTVVESQRALIDKARDRYDVVLLDTAPLLATNDALSLLPSVDMVLLVAREGRTDREAAAETIDILRRRRSRIAGVVLTGSSGFGRSRYYQKYRYGNYYDEESERTNVSVPGADLEIAEGARRSARARVSSN